MSKETLHHNKETIHDKELESLAEKQSKTIENAHEKARTKERSSAEREANPERLSELAEREAKKAKALEKKLSPEKRREKQKKVTNKARKDSYNKIMQETQQQLSAPSRVFSKVIHNAVVEKTSEITGKTIARPNAILYGSIFAIVAALSVYIVARHYGYALSGFESIGAFIIGWLFGILFDFFKTMILGKS